MLQNLRDSMLCFFNTQKGIPWWFFSTNRHGCFEYPNIHKSIPSSIPNRTTQRKRHGGSVWEL